MSYCSFIFFKFQLYVKRMKNNWVFKVRFYFYLLKIKFYNPSQNILSIIISYNNNSKKDFQISTQYLY